MSPDKVAYFRSLLENKRRELTANGNTKAEPIRHENERPDEDHQPLAEMNQAVASSRNQSAAAIIRAIEDALRLIADCPEDYGLCEECDEPVPQKRLELMPWVALCVQCQSRHETGRSTTRRNLTDFVS